MIRPPETRIETERLVLRPLTTDDLDAIVEGLAPYAVTRMLASVPHPFARANAEAWLKMCGGPDRTETALPIALDTRLVGVVGLTVDGYLGYWLAEPHWGKGYMTEAVRAFLTHVFATTPAKFIRSGMFTDNRASLQVQLKLGFRQVSVSECRCVARKKKLPYIDTRLARDQFVASG